MEIRNRTAVITGAGSGIGASLARKLCERGAHLALVDVRGERVEELAKELARDGRRITAHTADVRDRARMQALVGEITAAHPGGVQILVNNAGVTAWGSVEEMDLDDFQWVMDIDVWGVVHGCKFWLPHLKQQPIARIVNVSSMFGYVAIATQGAYCASKYAVRGFSEALAAELEGTPVGVMLVHPGGVATNFIHDSRANDPAFKSSFSELIARSQSPDEVAAAIASGLERNRERVVVGREAVVTDWLKRLMPVRGQRWTARFLGKAMNIGGPPPA